MRFGRGGIIPDFDYSNPFTGTDEWWRIDRTHRSMIFDQIPSESRRLRSEKFLSCIVWKRVLKLVCRYRGGELVWRVCREW